MGSEVILDPVGFHCKDKNSLNVLQNILFCVPWKKESQQHDDGIFAILCIKMLSGCFLCVAKVLKRVQSQFFKIFFSAII